MSLFAALSDWLVLGHVVASMVWVGGTAVLGTIAVTVLRDPEPQAVARFSRTLRAVGPVVLAPAPALLLAFGIWLTLRDPAWGFDQAWVKLALALFAAAFLVGAAHQSRAAVKAERAVAAGDDAAALHHLRRWTAGMGVIVALLLVTTWDMVFKPGL